MGNFGASEMFVIIIGTLLFWGIPIALVVWIVRTLSAIHRRQGEILQRIAFLENLRRGE